LGSSLLQKDEDGKVHTPPDSASKYERARTILLRAVSIDKAQHEVDLEKGLTRSDPQLRNLKADGSAYLMLAEVDLRLGNTEEALRLAQEGREARPMLPFAYQRLHDVLRAMGRRDEAMAALMQGLLLTSNKSLEQRLVADYADRPDEAKCAISYAEATPALDFSCGVVRKLACSVPGLKSDLTAKYGCTH
jgi:tetratricopeptide (TPR) repeat protein